MDVVERAEARKGWRQVRLSIVLSVGLLMAILGASALVIGNAQAQPFAPGLEGTSTPIPDCGLNWRPVTSPNSGTNSNQLTGVAVVSANDIWAVGFYAGGTAFQTLTMHYTNGQWTVVPSPSIGTSGNYLTGVAAVSANDIWAVGYYYNTSSNTEQTLTMHYSDGQWTVVPSPNVGTSMNHLTGVAAVSANDVWAVGDYVDGSAFQTLTMHYTNGQWTVVTSPNVSTSGNYLNGVAAVSANDVWAVGHYYDDGSKTEQTLTMYYTNGQWTVVTSPSVGTSNNYLTGVAAASANDVWAVGYYGPIGGPYQALTMHYTSGQWTVVPSPNVGKSSNALSGVTAVSANDVWAVGYYYDNSSGAEQTLTMHYSDGQWTVVPSPNVGTSQNYLSAVAAVSANDVWAVGRYLNMNPTPAYQTLTMHYSDPCVTATPTATAMPTVQATSTPIVCTLQFADVPADSSFYQYVRCLACQGIVSGYECGGEGEPCDGENNPYFRPNANVTRGQIAKIVSNSAGYDEDPGPQIYEDVPTSNPFYQWINRLTMRGHMGGYSCGGAGEPCGVEEMPYFRPFANATRAQLAKIVSNAAGLVDTGTEQIFTDVPPENGFYVWIQRLASRGIMGGYTCGGAGEPCDDQDRPYFRPYNTVTRGQTAKIVAGAFFPDCQVP